MAYTIVNKKGIKNYTLDDLKKEMLDISEKEYRAKQIYEWLYKKNVVTFDEMTNLSKDLILKLNEKYYIEDLKIIEKLESKDGTKKYLLGLPTGGAIECVLMKYKYGYTLCISTQKGCKMGCKFCASTKAKFEGDLQTGEIVDQILKIQREEDLRISNIVFMGIGEPLDNFDNLINAIKIINDPFGIEIGARHISISTSGLANRIRDLADLKTQCTLSISLHYTTDVLRSEIMPINRKYNIEELLDACRYYIKVTGRRVSFEYAMVDGLNDSLEDAKRLVSLIKDIKCHVNLIRINEIDETNYKKSTNDNILKFRDYLNDNNIVATIRRTLGEDIEAACGQLRKQNM